jgi:hypothetical protein
VTFEVLSLANYFQATAWWLNHTEKRNTNDKGLYSDFYGNVKEKVSPIKAARIAFVKRLSNLCLAKMLLGFEIKNLRTARTHQASAILKPCSPSFGSLGERSLACSVPVAVS